MSEEYVYVSKPVRNPKTRARHRREVLWQITIPLAVGVIIIVGLVAALGLVGIGDVGRWSDISIIWLLLPMLLLSLIPLALLGFGIYGLVRLLQVLPPFAYRLQQVFTRIERGVLRLADRSVEPLLRVRSSSAALRAFRRLGGRTKRDRVY